jgi:hypothetical protein
MSTTQAKTVTADLLAFLKASVLPLLRGSQPHVSRQH